MPQSSLEGEKATISLYDVLHIPTSATSVQVRKAYLSAARIAHPDKKSGSTDKFAQIQRAYYILGDPSRRRAYDFGARDVAAVVPSACARASDRPHGGEELMVEELDRLGVEVDSSSQLLVLCEVCGRPSTRECYACNCPFCSFCSRKMHSRPGVPLHWPMERSTSMRSRLGRSELERKRMHDTRALHGADSLEDSSEEFFAEHALASDPSLLYMWAQDADYVYVALYVPRRFGKNPHLSASIRGCDLVVLAGEKSERLMEGVLSKPLDYEASSYFFLGFWQALGFLILSLLFAIVLIVAEGVRAAADRCYPCLAHHVAQSKSRVRPTCGVEDDFRRPFHMGEVHRRADGTSERVRERGNVSGVADAKAAVLH